MNYRLNLIGVACLAALAFAAPAVAKDRYSTGDVRIDRASESARYGVGRIYRESGRRACGFSCGRAAERVGRGVFDHSRDFANRNGERLQDVGRRARERYERARGRRR